MTHNFVPMVLDRAGRSERAYDIYSLLLKERIIFLGTDVNPQSANVIVAQLLYLNAADPKQEIQLFINSPGGVIYSGFAIYDAMQQISAPISTVAVGMTASFSTLVLAAGTSGRRFALQNATIHMHQPHGGAQGQASDISIQATETLRLRDKMENAFSHHTGQATAKIRQDLDRDIYLTPQQAVEYGLIDSILSKVPSGQKEA